MNPSSFRCALLLALGGVGSLGCSSPGSSQDQSLAQGLWSELHDQASWVHFDDYPGIQPGDGSHGEYIQTRINAVAAADQLGLPPGSIAVKANYDDAAGKELTSYVAMQRVPGFDPAHGDWFYATYSPDGKVLQAGASDACVRCHRAAGDGDYVFYNDRL